MHARGSSPVVRALLCAALAASGCSVPGRFLRGYAEADATGMESLGGTGAYAHAPAEVRGQVRFVFDDFGSLTTDVLDTYALPWKVVGAALVLEQARSAGAPVSTATLEAVLRRFGFLTPRRIANWEGPQPRLERPLGVVAGVARRGLPAVELEIANVGCAACHAGPLYGADGQVTADAWLGLPNSSLDLSGYADHALAALQKGLSEPDTLLAIMDALFPIMGSRERSTIRKHVLPDARAALEARQATLGGLLPFENGGPGLMNGVGSLRFLLGLSHEDARPLERAWASPPDLTGTTLRRTLLSDGAYAPPGSSRYGPLTREERSPGHIRELAGIASLFLVGTQGVEPEVARRAIPSVEEVLEFADRLQPPPFPGPIDSTLASAGRAVYERDCAVCHGVYAREGRRERLVLHPNRLTAQDRMGTDPVRWQAADSLALATVEASGYDRYLDALNDGGYVAPDLAGLWATAPYLHNGSVPTLWHLLHAAQRPRRFWVGGHALDLERVGIRGEVDARGDYGYPADYVPWSQPFLYDTREPGRGNQGHEFRTLTDEERHALLEYLKLL